MLNNFWCIAESSLEFKEITSENSIKCNLKKKLSRLFSKFAVQKDVRI